MSVEFIAEIGANHNGDVYRLRRLMWSARLTGFDSIKLQYVKSAEDIYRRGFPGSVETLPKNFKLERVKQWAGDCKLGFSVFNPAHIEELLEYADFWKVSSYDAYRIDDLIQPLRWTGKPVIVSLGLANPWPDNHRLKFLHCVSRYPTEVQEAGLSRIVDGYSDHTVKPSVIYRAVHRWDAKIVEMHYDLDGNGKEAGHSWTTDLAGRVIKEVREGLLADEEGLPNTEERKWMADSSDGKRPLKRYQEELYASSPVSA